MSKPKKGDRCIICGEIVFSSDEYVGGNVKGGGNRFAHKRCWDREQAETCKKVKK